MDNLSEKDHVGEVGDPEAHRIKSEALSPSLSDFDFTPEEQKNIIRRVDYRLVTTVGAMYVSISAPYTFISAVWSGGLSRQALGHPISIPLRATSRDRALTSIQSASLL